MSDTIANYSEILDFGKEKLKEGDYLKLASFLKSLTEPEEIIRELKNPLNIQIKFETFKGKHYELHIQEEIRVLYKGSKPNETYYSGTCNGVPFRMEEDDFLLQWKNRCNFYGLKNIQRSFFDEEIETFSGLGEFKKHLHERWELEIDDSHNDDDEDPCSYQLGFVIALLFGIKSMDSY